MLNLVFYIIKKMKYKTEGENIVSSRQAWGNKIILPKEEKMQL